MDKAFETYEFNYATFNLEPYSGNSSNSSILFKEIILKIQDKDFPPEKKVINRNKNRINSVKRELVNISVSFEPQGKRCFGKMALIKNKDPKIWAGKDIIEEIQKEKNRKFIEVTNYVIHFDVISPIMMIEFNSEGPRWSDIEYYFRQVSKEFKISKSLKSTIHLDIEYADLEKEISNVFNINAKVKKSAFLTLDKLKTSNNWISKLSALKEESGFEDVRLEMFFKRNKNPNSGFYDKNIRGLEYVRNILDWFKQSPNNLDHVDDLKLEYQAGDDPKILDIDFLKNKTRSIINVPLIGTSHRQIEYKELVGVEFSNYIKSGKTNTPNR